jgi:uroporphyrinogen decarboxylase
MMTHRERVLAALNHRTPDRVPVDIGGTFASTINVRAYDKLKAYLGVPERPTEFDSRRSATAKWDEDVLQKLDVDCRGVIPRGASRTARDLPDGSYEDAWGVTWAHPHSEGHYYVRKPVLTGVLTADTLKNYPWPDPDDATYTDGLRERARKLHEETDYAVILCPPVGVFHQCQFMRGYDQWLIDAAADPVAFAGLADAVLEYWMGLARNLIRACMPYIDAIFYGDDIAFQNGPMMGPAMFRRTMKPRLKQIMDMYRQEAGARIPIIYHTCGAAASLIPDLIDIGVTCLNPVQVAATGMDTAVLKKQFGRDMAFLGGVDTQWVLPFGTPDDVRAEVRRRVADLNADGGYILGAVHNIQAEVPPENVAAMVDEAHKL